MKTPLLILIAFCFSCTTNAITPEELLLSQIRDKESLLAMQAHTNSWNESFNSNRAFASVGKKEFLITRAEIAALKYQYVTGQPTTLLKYDLNLLEKQTLELEASVKILIAEARRKHSEELSATAERAAENSARSDAEMQAILLQRQLQALRWAAEDIKRLIYQRR